MLGVFSTESGPIHWATVRLSDIREEQYVLEVSGFDLEKAEPVRDLIVCNRRGGAILYTLDSIEPKIRDVELFRVGGELLLVDSGTGQFHAYRLSKGSLIPEELVQLPQDAEPVPFVSPVYSVGAP